MQAALHCAERKWLFSFRVELTRLATERRKQHSTVNWDNQKHSDRDTQKHTDSYTQRHTDRDTQKHTQQRYK